MPLAGLMSYHSHAPAAPPSAAAPAAVAERLAASIRVKPEVVVTTPDQVAAKTGQEGKRKPVVFFDYRQKDHHG